LQVLGQLSLQSLRPASTISKTLSQKANQTNEEKKKTSKPKMKYRLTPVRTSIIRKKNKKQKKNF
jgi:hypothetical protein